MLSVFAGKTTHSIAIKKPFLFSLNYFGSIYNKSFMCFGCLMDIKEHSGCQQTQIFSMYGFIHSQRHFKTHLLFLPGVAEHKLDIVDPIIL